MLARTGTEAGGNEDFRRGGRGVSPYPRRIQRPLKSITAPAAKYCMGRCKVFHRTLKTCSSSFSFRNCLIIGKLLLLAKVRKKEHKTKRKTNFLLVYYILCFRIKMPFPNQKPCRWWVRERLSRASVGGRWPDRRGSLP